MKLLRPLLLTALCSLLASSLHAQVPRITGTQTVTDSFVLPSKADPGTPTAKELWLSTTTSDALKYRNAAGTTTYQLVRTSDIGTSVQAYSANLAAIAGGTWTGASSITTVGTISSGTWQGTAIGDNYLASALTGKTYNGLTITTSTGTLTVANGVTVSLNDWFDQSVKTTASPTFANPVVTSLSLGATTPGVIGGSSGAITLTAGGTDQPITIIPSGTAFLRTQRLSTPATGNFVLKVLDEDAFDVQAQHLSGGADVSGSPSRTNSTNKRFAITGVHYLNAEENFLIMRGESTSANNQILIGGGSSSFNAATSYIFYGAEDTTTTTGTARVTIDIRGRLQAAAADRSTGASWGTTGIGFDVRGSTITNTVSSGTVATAVMTSFSIPTFAASNSTTFTNAANLYIAGDVAAGTNVTLTNSYGLWNVGKTRLDGGLYFGGTTPGSISGSSGSLSLAAAGSNNDITITPSGTGILRVVGSADVSGTGLSVGANGNGNTGVQVNAAGGTSRGFYFRTNSSGRWDFEASSAAESSGNAGSNFVITRRSDAGGFLDFALQITRATGLFSVYGTLRPGVSAASASSWTTNGIQLQVPSATFTDSSTAASGTAASAVFSSFARPTLAATNATVTTTDAATVYVANSPLAGTNITITNPWAIWVDAGNVRLDGTIRTAAGADWDLGAANAVSPTSPNRTVTVTIGGTTYYLHAKTTND